MVDYLVFTQNDQAKSKEIKKEEIEFRINKIMTIMNFANMYELLPEEKFIRVHRSFVVAIEKIDHIERKRIKISEKIIPISESYKEEFFREVKGDI